MCPRITWESHHSCDLLVWNCLRYYVCYALWHSINPPTNGGDQLIPGVYAYTTAYTSAHEKLSHIVHLGSTKKLFGKRGPSVSRAIQQGNWPNGTSGVGPMPLY